jgi:Mg2+-importing ATPase
MDDARLDELRQEYEHLSRDGFRVLAIGSKDVEPSGAPPSYGRDDEKDVILGYLAFLYPPKDTAATAIRSRCQEGVLRGGAMCCCG